MSIKDRFFTYINKHKYLTAALVYIAAFFLVWISLFNRSEYLYDSESDVYTFLYPVLVRLRDFYTDAFHGNFSVIDFGRLFGSDIILRPGYIGNPLYFAVAFLSDDGLLHFFKYFYMVMLFLSGISFIYMCCYFGKNPVRASVFSVLYICCPFLLWFGVCYNCYIPNLVSLPVLIVAMDKILNNKSGKMMIICSALTMICNLMNYWIYNIFIVVVYAVVKVVFMKDGKIPGNLIRYGVKGGSCALAGLLLAGFSFFPQLEGILSSGRITDKSSDLLSSLLYFDSKGFTDMLSVSITYISVGFIQIFFVFLFLISEKQRKEAKALIMLCILAVAFPGPVSGLNAFNYVEHRWAFGLALISAYAAVCVSENIKDLSVSERLFSEIVLTLFLIALESDDGVALIAVILVLIIAYNIKPIRDIFEKVTRSDDDSIQKKTEYGILIVSLVVCVVRILLFTQLTEACLICESVILYLFASGKSINVLKIPAGISALAYAVILIINYGYPDFSEETVYDTDEMYMPLRDISIEEENASGVPVRFDNSFDKKNQNTSYMYGIHGDSSMFSILPGRYLSMIRNGRFDLKTYEAVNSVVGLGSRMPYLSVFGIDFITRTDMDAEGISEAYNISGADAVPVDLPYGFRKYKEYHTSSDTYSVYRNDYSLPFGFCYGHAVSASDRLAMNGAENGISMMYAAGVDDMVTDIDRITTETHSVGYKSKCEKVSIGAGDDVYYNYVIDLDSAVTDSELYVDFSVVSYDDPYSTIKITTDNGISVLGDIYSNVMADEFKWITKLDRYAIRVGDVTDSEVNMISIMSAFPIDNIEITVFSHEDFISCYNELNRYTMKNVSLGYDRLSGDIYVPDKRILAMSLQYDSYWTAYDNGRKVSTFPVNECMTGLILDEGEHRIELRYSNKMFSYGLIISLVSSLTGIIYMILEKYKVSKRS